MEATIHCKFDTLADPRTLQDHAKNRNKHSDEQVERLAKLYSYHGVRHPIIVSSLSGCIVAGHGRKLAAIKAGIKEMPVVFQSFADEVAEYAFIQADNAIASWADLDLAGINADLGDLGPDFDLEMLGIEDFALDIAEKLDPGCDEDEVPEARPEPKVVQGEVYILGNHRLMCGDSTAITDVERLMNGEKAQVCVTDPPYGIAYQSNYRSNKFDQLKNDDVILKEWIGCAHAFTDSWIIFFIGWQRMSEWLEVGSQLGKLTNILVWRKSAAMGDLEGSFAPTYELALAYNRGGKLNGGRPSAVIEQNIDHADSFEHPTQKPIMLCEKILEHLPKGSVLDLFGGSGWSLIACEKIGRSCFMMELDPIYCGVILDRWQKFTGKKAHREDGVAWDEIKGAE